MGKSPTDIRMILLITSRSRLIMLPFPGKWFSPPLGGPSPRVSPQRSPRRRPRSRSAAVWHLGPKGPGASALLRASYHSLGPNSATSREFKEGAGAVRGGGPWGEEGTPRGTQARGNASFGKILISRKIRKFRKFQTFVQN